MKLWLDDIREPPAPWIDIDEALKLPPHIKMDWWVWAKDAESAIYGLRFLELSECSLDHDLGGEMSGYDVVKFMCEYEVWPEVVKVHSMNPVGRQNMLQLIERYKP